MGWLVVRLGVSLLRIALLGVTLLGIALLRVPLLRIALLGITLHRRIPWLSIPRLWLWIALLGIPLLWVALLRDTGLVRITVVRMCHFKLLVMTVIIYVSCRNPNT